MFPGAAFGTNEDGDLFADDTARRRVAGDLGIGSGWAWMSQVHGAAVIPVDSPGRAGEGDALITNREALPLAVRTADCVPLVLHADGGAAIVHAGWRGIAAGVIEAAVQALTRLAGPVMRAAIGPAIGRCCYEVGEEVLAALPDHHASTSWGTASVDLGRIAESRITSATARSVRFWRSDLCTRCEEEFHSFRATGTAARQTSVAWL